MVEAEAARREPRDSLFAASSPWVTSVSVAKEQTVILGTVGHPGL